MKRLNGAAVVAAWGALAVGGAAPAQEAVQWRVEDGGNGHWYRGVSTSNIVDLAQATALANAVGGYPVTITSPGESQLITALSDNDALWANYWAGPVIGLHVDGDDCLPGCWVSGERFDYSNWHPGNPDVPATDNCVILFQRNMRRWQNYPCTYGFQGTLPHSVIVEWSADCNGDGIVDYGQILDGTFEDANANGVPDCCDESVSCDRCPADVNQDGVVNGADISAVLGFWGLAGKPLPAADITRDGIVDGADLAVLLGSWGPCQ